MNKEEFINKLKKKLDILEKSEIDDIVSEYEGYIDEKMSSGMSEKEAVKALGDINEIAKDLLSAYKIKDDYKKENNGINTINNFIDSLMNSVDSFINMFKGKSSKEVVRIFLDILILIIIISIFHFPFELLEELSYDILMIFGNTIGLSLYKIWEFILDLIYFTLAIIFFFKILKEKIITKYDEEEKKVEEKNEIENNKEKNDVIKKDKTIVESRKSILDVFANIWLIFVKFVVGMITIVNSFYIIGISALLVVVIYALIKGIAYYGILFIALGLLAFGIAFIEVFINFIFDQKQHFKRFIIVLILSLLISGIGIGLFTTEIAQTEIVDVKQNENIQIYTENIEMKNNIVMTDYYVNDYIVDEALDDEIKIEYKYYFDYLKFEPSMHVEDYMGYSVYHFEYDATWNKKMLDKLIKDLKDKKLYNYRDIFKVNIYSNGKNIEKIKDNNKNYNELDNYEEDRDCFIDAYGDYIC